MLIGMRKSRGIRRRGGTIWRPRNSQVFVDYRPNQTALTFTRIGHSDRGIYIYQLLCYTAYFVCR